MKPKFHIAFTICSNNYLGQALTLKNSFLKYNPTVDLYIVLVDKLHESIDYDVISPAKLLPIAEIEGLDLDNLIARYYIIELNTSVKPSVFKYFIKNNRHLETIYYLDPDLYFYNSLKFLNKSLDTKLALLTPHILTPIPNDGKQPSENVFLQYGIYNLGFLGINAKHPEVFEMLDWWEEKTLNFGYDLSHKGYFVDQLWMSQVPTFFNNVEVLKTFNFNMAPWNLHERKIINIDGDKIKLNDGTDLVFYHFSKISGNLTDISTEFNRFKFDELPLLAQLYKSYYDELERNNFNSFRNIQIAYHVQLAPYEKQKLSNQKWGNKNNLLAKFFIMLARLSNRFRFNMII